jgi:hypothetical protein
MQYVNGDMQDVSHFPTSAERCNARRNMGIMRNRGYRKGKRKEKRETSKAESNPEYRTSERHAEITEGKGQEGISTNAS